MRLLTLLALACSLATAQIQDPASDPLEKGYQALRSGREADAVQWFVRATEQMPASALARKELGYAYLRLGQEADARRELEQAAQLDPNDARLALEIAFCWQRAADAQRARQWFEHAAARGGPEIRQTARGAIAYLDAARAANASPKASPSASPNVSPNAATNAPPSASGASADPVHAAVHEAMTRAYAALRDKDYDAAILALQDAVKAAPKRAGIRKQLAYAYLKIGETAWARDMFEQAVRLDPNDYRGALELAFLRHETGDIAPARELFAAVALADDPQLDPQLKATAEAALRRVDAELTASIARWKEAVAMDPLNRSAQLELADLYQKYGEPAKAVDHYLAGWLVPSEQPRDEILPKLARARQAAGDAEGASGAWLLASRSNEPRIAEAARPHLPKRHPYASEFRRALELNPRDTLLRRDLAYLQLEVGNVEEARKEFEIVVAQDPNDLLASAQLAFLYLERNHAAEAVSLLERASRSANQGLSQEASDAQTPESQAQPHHDLGEQSLKKSYLKDALREFLRAYEVNPGDHEAALKIGIISNLMKRDREAMRWFLIAAESPDADIAQQARLSYDNLAPQYKRFTTTLWTFPFFSTRYHSAFQYSQLKTEMRVGDLPIRPYLSLRLVGDIRQRTGEASPQFLSESSLIAGVGVRAPLAHGVSLWAEAGEAISYLGERPPGVPRAGPDYRGGINWFYGRGAHLGGRRSGFFHEINFDGVYVSRFDDDWIAYSQFRPGYRLPTMGAVRAQLYWNFNMTADRNRAYWANFVETGPGVRLRLGGGNRPLDFSINFLRGVHLINAFNPRRPNYYDLRIGLWYSMSM